MFNNNKHDYFFLNIKHVEQWPWDKKDSQKQEENYK